MNQNMPVQKALSKTWNLIYVDRKYRQISGSICFKKSYAIFVKNLCDVKLWHFWLQKCNYINRQAFNLLLRVNNQVGKTEQLIIGENIDSDKNWILLLEIFSLNEIWIEFTMSANVSGAISEVLLSADTLFCRLGSLGHEMCI